MSDGMTAVSLPFIVTPTELRFVEKLAFAMFELACRYSLFLPSAHTMALTGLWHAMYCVCHLAAGSSLSSLCSGRINTTGSLDCRPSRL